MNPETRKKQAKPRRLVLDTAQGGHKCWGCHRVFMPDEPQVILGMEDEIKAVCLECLESGLVKLW